eukprot:scaffold72539_cov63-Phaeocystis_antarctica.AAC.2
MAGQPEHICQLWPRQAEAGGRLFYQKSIYLSIYPPSACPGAGGACCRASCPKPLGGCFPHGERHLVAPVELLHRGLRRRRAQEADEEG